MLPSEELLAKYRAAEKNGASDPAPVSAEADKTVSAPEVKTTTEQPATVQENQDHGKTEPNTPAPVANSEGEKDERTRYQRDWEKRLKRQERAHQAQMDELRRQNEELRKLLGVGSNPELTLEDFPSREKYEEYKEKQMRERIKGELREEDRVSKEQEAQFNQQRERAQEKLKATFKTPEAIAEFQEILRDFTEDEQEFLESDNGKLYQEIVDNSPVGLIMTQLCAKNPNFMNALKSWSKEMMLHQLERLEHGIIQKAQEAAKAKTAQPAAPVASPATASAPAKPIMPSTGDIGKATAVPGKFSAKDWLRKNRPERYH